MNLVPYKFQVNLVVLFDMVSNYADDVKALTSTVVAGDGKTYNVFNPMYIASGDQDKSVKGVMRSTLKPILEKVSHNPYHKSSVIGIGNEKLPNNTNGLAALMEPILRDMADQLPFAANYVLGTADQVTIHISDEEGTETGVAPVKNTGRDLLFSDFVSMTGWPEVISDGNLKTVSLTICVKFVARNTVDLVSVLERGHGLVDATMKKNCTFGVLFNSNDFANNSEAFAALVSKGYRVITNSTERNDDWMPPSKTAMEERVMKALDGQRCDLLLVKGC